MLTLREAVSRALEDKSVLGWRPHAVTVKIAGGEAYLKIDWSWPPEAGAGLSEADLDGELEHIEKSFKPRDVSMRDWLSPPADLMRVVPPSKAEMIEIAETLGAARTASDEADGEDVHFVLWKAPPA